ncbi:MAG: DUF192 domain-containing protein [Candidatus Micrarchaeota archaeon]|nr:DUF192 domain-containing protein [Candidatus Micrarchaeota archaeon]
MKEVLPIVVLILGVLFVAYHGSSVQQSGPMNYSSFTIGNRSFAITYVATNQSSWESGLMNKTISNATTMLFIFPNQGIYPFWMLDTYTNLDMYWIRGNATSGRIVYIVRNATSCFNAENCEIYTPNAAANYVIETKAGALQKASVELNDQVGFK